MSPVSPIQSPPPRSASSSSRITTDDIVMEIDSSMSRTLHTIDNEVDTRVVRKKKPPRPAPDGRPRENGYRSMPEERQVQQSQESKPYSEVTRTTVTSTEIADKFTGLMSGAPSPVVGDRPTEHTVGTISPEILQAIREQMAVSLQRMRELEDQVRVMPVMEDQISTLQSENKRLYHLLSRLTEDQMGHGVPTVNGDAGFHVEGDENVRTFRGEQGSILVELPLKVGKEKVADESSYSMRSTETRTETRTDVHETNAAARRAFFWGTPDDSDTMRMSPETFRLFKPSRTVGVGDGNVFDVGGLVDGRAWRKTRDVGVLCLPASRDVSVSVAEATDEELQEEHVSGGARVSLTVTVSDERSVCEPRWEVERFGSGLYQDVAVECLIIGGFLTYDRQYMSKNVDGWLVESNRLWTYSADDELAPLTASTLVRLEYQPDENRSTMLADHMSPEDGFIHEQSMSEVNLERQSASLDRVLSQFYQTHPNSRVSDSIQEEKAVSAPAISMSPEDGFIQEQSFSAVKLEQQSASLDGLLSKLYQTQPDSAVSDTIEEEKAVSARANPPLFDLNARFRKLQEKAQSEDHVVKEDIIIAQSKPQAASSCTDKAVFDLRAKFAQLQEVQEQTIKEDVIVAQSATPRTSSLRVEKLVMEDLVHRPETSDSRLTHDTMLSTTSAEQVPSVLMDQTLSTQTSSLSEGGMVVTKTEVTREVTVETSLQLGEKESSDESSGVQPFPPHLSRITASSVSDDDTLNDQQQQHDVTTLEMTTVTVVEAASPGTDAVVTSQPSTAAAEQVSSDLSDQTLTTQTSTVSEGGVVITKTEVTREVTKVITGSEVASEVTTSSIETVDTSSITSGEAEIVQFSSPDLIDTSHPTSTVITTEVGEVQQHMSSGEVGSVSVRESIPDVSKDETTPQETYNESMVVTTEVGSVQQLPGEVVPAAEVGAVTTDMAANQSQGCHIIITETRIERQLIGCDSDQSQPVVIVPEDTVIQ